MRGARYSSIAISYALGIPQELDRHLPHAVPHLPPPVADPHLVERILEIRSLPPMYPADARHLERTALQSAAADVLIAAARSEAVSLRTLPLQFRQLSSPPRAGGAEAPERCDGLISLARDLCKPFPILPCDPIEDMPPQPVALREFRMIELLRKFHPDAPHYREGPHVPGNSEGNDFF